jgi:hypothetical protein
MRSSAVQVMTESIQYGWDVLHFTQELPIPMSTERAIVDVSLSVLQLRATLLLGCVGKRAAVKLLGNLCGRHCVELASHSGVDSRQVDHLLKGACANGHFAVALNVASLTFGRLCQIVEAARRIFLQLASGSGRVVWSDGSALNTSASFFLFAISHARKPWRAGLMQTIGSVFRAAAVQPTDLRTMAEAQLRSLNCEDAHALSFKLVLLYEICSKQLSAQPHYDFGDRQIRLLLRALWKLNVQAPIKDFAQEIVRVFLAQTASKLTEDDAAILDSFFELVFPAIKVPMMPSVSAAITTAAVELGFVLHAPWLAKLGDLQLASSSNRMVILVGAPASGKSTAVSVLARMNQLDTIRFYPSLELDEIFGYIHRETEEAVSGFLEKHLLRFSKQGVFRGLIAWDDMLSADLMLRLRPVLYSSSIRLGYLQTFEFSPDTKLCFEVGELGALDPAMLGDAAVIFFADDTLSWKARLRCAVSLILGACIQSIMRCGGNFRPLLCFSNRYLFDSGCLLSAAQHAPQLGHGWRVCCPVCSIRSRISGSC